jgi:hypothetical protein
MSVGKTCREVGVFNNSGSTVSLHVPAVTTLSDGSALSAVTRQAADDLPGAEPATLTGALVGYARVSTKDQRLDRQTLALEAAGCIRIFADKKSGKDADREELTKALDYLLPGDTLVVPSLDRLARSLQDLITIVADLRRRSVGFRSLKEALDTTTPGGRLVFHVFAALAEFIRELIVEGTHEGLASRSRDRPCCRRTANSARRIGSG